MNVDIIAYLKKNLRPDPDMDLTNEVIDYIAKIDAQEDVLELWKRMHFELVQRLDGLQTMIIGWNKLLQGNLSNKQDIVAGAISVFSEQITSTREPKE